ncbi:methyltransferase domain-containing protein [bacterium BMS3Abin03]|nr:methyltransferase domain-containing protein [bacterium BMS3Abin03]
MKNYLQHTFDSDDPELISIIDELPLWSAPFGLKLLDNVQLKPNINVLDVGCGLGFPLIELSQRFGNTCKFYGVDPWQSALKRAQAKIYEYKITNTVVTKSIAEKLPFKNNSFDLIVSNNGTNNVQDIRQTLSECFRVSNTDAQFLTTMNLENSIIEFYNVFEETLIENNLKEEVGKMKAHIYSKRKPIDEMKSLIENSGFKIKNIIEDNFSLRFLNALTMFNHTLIKYWFLGSWKDILKPENLEKIFKLVEVKLDKIAKQNGEIKLTIPYVLIDCKHN